jgi:hypothetical protein
MHQSELKRRIEELTARPAQSPIRVVTDTSAFMNIWRGHVIRLGNRFFLVMRDMKEGRFGIDDEPKFWVKIALDLESGEGKILKLAFHEEFTVRIGLLRIRCYRDPLKEGELLDVMRGDTRFMQGWTVEDECGKAIGSEKRGVRREGFDDAVGVEQDGVCFRLADQRSLKYLVDRIEEEIRSEKLVLQPSSLGEFGHLSPRDRCWVLLEAPHLRRSTSVIAAPLIRFRVTVVVHPTCRSFPPTSVELPQLLTNPSPGAASPPSSAPSLWCSIANSARSRASSSSRCGPYTYCLDGRKSPSEPSGERIG